VYSIANKLVEPAKILIIVGIAYTLATTGWYFVGGPTSQSPAIAAATGVEGPATPSLEDVVGYELFGKADAEQVVAAPTTFDAPETRLKLTLEGVFAADDDPALSSAIVAEQNRPGELYVIGAKMPGNAVLAEVHPDRIVLRRGTTFETLRFSDEPRLLSVADQAMLQDLPEAPPEEFYEEPVEDVAPDAEADAGPPDDSSSATGLIEKYREQLNEDPRGTLDDLGVAPVADGAARGYRLENLSASPNLSQTGLQPGDVILSVNGRPVGDVQQDQQQIDNIMAQGSARLEVQRGARRFFVTASLK